MQTSERQARIWLSRSLSYFIHILDVLIHRMLKISFLIHQFLRLHFFCSDNTDFIAKSEEMCQFLRDRETTVQKSQWSKEKGIPFTLAYHPNNHATK